MSVSMHLLTPRRRPLPTAHRSATSPPDRDRRAALVLTVRRPTCLPHLSHVPPQRRSQLPFCLLVTIRSLCSHRLALERQVLPST
jgi:hypothetical protein